MIFHNSFINIFLQMKEDGTISLLRAVNIGDLCVGTLGDSCSTVPESAPLIDVLVILKKYRLPAVPILSREGTALFFNIFHFF